MAAASLAAALAVGGCGGSGAGGTHPSQAITLLMATAPDSLDPAVGYTTQALEADRLVYTPLITYAHSDGITGTRLIPGLAESLPTITDAGRTYTLTLRKRLAYSDGRPVRAGDFTWAVERAIKLSWGGARKFLTSRISGAGAFASGKAKAISGITTDDATGQITIRLTSPFGAFENVLATPALAPVPRSTPLADEQRDPPSGVGPYELTSVVVGRSFSLVKNPAWTGIAIPQIPAGHVGIEVRISPDARANALAVLHDKADVLDSASTIPSGLLARIESQAPDRFSQKVMNGTDLIFMNATTPPFSSLLAREAVITAFDLNALGRLAAGTLTPGCYLLPPTVYGHPHTACPYGDPAGGGNLPAAEALVGQSRMRGARVTVWSPVNDPAREWMSYYTSLLNRLGFRATQKLIPDARYRATIGGRSLHPQTGLAGLTEKFPNPAGFYRSLNGVDDPYLAAQVGTLAGVPAAQLSAVAAFWHALEQYVASKAYVAVLGYRTFPQFVSDRIDYPAIIFDPVGGLDWSSLQLK